MAWHGARAQPTPVLNYLQTAHTLLLGTSTQISFLMTELSWVNILSSQISQTLTFYYNPKHTWTTGQVWKHIGNMGLCPFIINWWWQLPYIFLPCSIKQGIRDESDILPPPNFGRIPYFQVRELMSILPEFLLALYWAYIICWLHTSKEYVNPNPSGFHILEKFIHTKEQLSCRWGAESTNTKDKRRLICYVYSTALLARWG